MSSLSQTLPPKEQKVFDQMSKQFDNRDYAKAIRSADQILAVAPEHGETLAMKGLSLHATEKREEGLALVKEGVSKSMRSAICWHSLGMCHRSDKNHLEAQKAFKFATKCDPKNMNVLRDLASISIHLRDWECFFDSREKLLGLKANIRANWIALSCAYKMLNQTELAGAFKSWTQETMPWKSVRFIFTGRSLSYQTTLLKRHLISSSTMTLTLLTIKSS